MKLNDKYKYTRSIAWQIEPINDFVYIYNLRKSVFLTLDDVGKDIWLMINENKNIQEMINKLSMEYGVDDKIVKTDIIELLNNLLSEGVIECYE